MIINSMIINSVTFNSMNRYYMYSYQAVLAMVLSLFMTSLYAEVSVKNIEKNDKITGSALPAQGVLPDPANNIRKAGTRKAGAQKTGNKSKSWVLHAEQWELTRSGESILSLPVLNEFINAWLEDRKKKIEIQYPGGEEGEFWVQELTDWLVSLGIPSNHMVIVAGSGSDDMIRLNIIK